MTLGRKKPGGLLLVGFRLPILLYRLHLGWILGERFLLLTHIGRESGLSRRTVLEVVGRKPSTGAYLVVSAFGKKADWFLNISRHPDVTIKVKRRSMPVRARQLPETDGVRALLDYAKRHPVAFREMSRLFTGKPFQPTAESCRRFIQSRPIVAFEPYHDK
ncbi:MAG TPA: nitroreductase family deazaflavin-dependent oxidoreductase [Anaerolineales bacterium]|nr:nitroreductase family deazaflavin-dependent oxidoreductase [Anaerolineales bacterium]